MSIDKQERTDPREDVPDPLRKNLDWYIEHQGDLSKQHNGKVLLIVDQQLIGAFGSMAQAYDAATKKYQPGTFSLQKCSPDRESYSLTVFSPGYNART